MPFCSIRWCGKHSKTSNYKKDGITFHRFPTVPEYKEKWLNAVQRENWFPTKYSSVCSRHFTTDCFESLKNRRRLYNSAVPTLFLPVLSSSSLKKEVDPHECGDPKLHAPDCLIVHDSTTTISQTANVDPQKRKMKQHIDHLKFSLEQKKKIIKKLQYKNRLLNKRVSSLQVMIKTLTKKSHRTKENEDKIKK